MKTVIDASFKREKPYKTCALHGVLCSCRDKKEKPFKKLIKRQ